ncbi:MAG: heme d1 biosynthesis radical SAM protein NirJ [Burkholderiales bacterium]|nr:heme d1 biosynthesis radical SAM protein NirJ [Burkholderiales bacterium]
MFRVSQFMQELAAPTPVGPKRNPPGPVVIWNLIRRCNLTCRHCYSVSADIDFPGELSTAEVFGVMDDLKRFGVPVLILSGGEPLLRPDIFDIAHRARAEGFYTALSTNGTLMDAPHVARVAEVGFDYVGISLDGRRATHDRFRRKAGAFDASIDALRRCRDAGIKIGVRFTLTEANRDDLPWLLALTESEGIDKFYLSHLNYAGRGNVNRRHDAYLATTRRAMDLLFDTCWDRQSRGLAKEFVTGNNDADGVYFLLWVRRNLPHMEAHVRAKLAQWGGNSSGVNVANIDNIGDVHPDTYWWDYTLGNVRQRAFSEIWRDDSDPIMAGLKASPRSIKGRCGACAYFDVCGGNTRTRARSLTGDAWEEDPGCYLDDEEIGVAPERARLSVSPYSRRKAAAT